jgi:hypothetical protein
MKDAIDTPSYVIIHIPSFMKTGIGDQAILRFSSAVCEVVMLALSMDVIYDRCHSYNLWWHDTRTKFYEYWFMN